MGGVCLASCSNRAIKRLLRVSSKRGKALSTWSMCKLKLPRAARGTYSFRWVHISQTYFKRPFSCLGILTKVISCISSIVRQWRWTSATCLKGLTVIGCILTSTDTREERYGLISSAIDSLKSLRRSCGTSFLRSFQSTNFSMLTRWT